MADTNRINMSGNIILSTESPALTAVGNTTDWHKFSGNFTVQAFGTATTFTAVLERSSRYPGPTGALANPSPSASGINGNLTNGNPPAYINEGGCGWWRVRVTAISGGTATIAMSGPSF